MAVELGRATADQARRLFLRFFPQGSAPADAALRDYPERLPSPAQVQQLLLAASDADDAGMRLKKAIEQRRER